MEPKWSLSYLHASAARVSVGARAAAQSLDEVRLELTAEGLEREARLQQ